MSIMGVGAPVTLSKEEEISILQYTAAFLVRRVLANQQHRKILALDVWGKWPGQIRRLLLGKINTLL